MIISVIKRLAETRLTRTDIVYLALRIYLAYFFFAKLGFCVGILAIVTFNALVDNLVIKIYKVEPLNTTD